MDTQKLCQNCQAPLATDAPRGLCPACLMKVALATGTVAGPEKPGFTPPGIEELARKFPQLELLELIGRGGMGAVYKARQKELDRIVALKILPPGIGEDAAFAERFAREAKALARLNHPGIVTIHDFGRADGLFFFVMEFVDGVNLRQLLATGRVSAREALAIVPQICDALQYAHDQGIVHRDIKPENLLLDRRGRVKVADFGLAKLVQSTEPRTAAHSPSDAERVAASPGKAPDLTEAGKVMGTPNYMAPEQLEHPGEVDHRADIYALGVVFYQMLTGELPGKRIEPPSKRVQIDVRLDEVVLRALEKKPELRYQQVSEVKTLVETIAATVGPTTSPSERAEAKVTKPRQDWWTWSPLQSREVGEICAHLTGAERNHLSVLGLLSSAWVVATCFGLPAFLRANSGDGKWLVAGVWVVLFAVSIPMLQRMVRHFLCSTAWAREHGCDPSRLRLFSFRRANLWKACAVLTVGLGLIFAQHKAIISYLGLDHPPLPDRYEAPGTEKPDYQPNQAPATPPLAPAAVPAEQGFGPVIERTLVDSKAPFASEAERTNAPIMIDFTSGSLLAGSGAMWAADTSLQKAWMITNGVDALAVLRGVNGLVGLDMKAVSVPAQAWNDLSASSVADRLAQINSHTTVLFSTGQSSPPTWLFQTRKGSMGILQITGFGENPRWVKLRYKLAQSSKGSAALNPIPSQAAELFAAYMKYAEPYLQGHDMKDTNVQATFSRETSARVKQIEALLTGTIAAPLVEQQHEQLAELRFASQVGDGAKAREASGRVTALGNQIGKLLAATGNPPLSANKLPTLQFRWVAANGDTQSPAEVLTNSNGQALRVLLEVVLTSEDVLGASFTQYESDQKELAASLTPLGGQKFAAATGTHIGRQLAIVWNGRVVSAPVVRTAITNGRVTMSGRFSDAEANQLLYLLNHLTPATPPPPSVPKAGQP